jgi:RNA polymerase sigma factor (sigma-70 family)
MNDQQFEKLYRGHRDAILAYLLRRVTNAEDAADLLTEVFVVAVRRGDDVPRDDATRLWLYGVARRLLANHRRGLRRHDEAVARLADELRTMAAAVPAPAAELIVLRQQLATLSADDRELLTLTAWDGLTPMEAAAVLGLTPTTARARLFRARRRLQARLASIEDPSDDHEPRRELDTGKAAVASETSVR